MCVCDIKSNQSTSKKPHYVSDLSKPDALLHKTNSKVDLVIQYQGSTCADPKYHYVEKHITCGSITHPHNKTRQQKEQQGFPNIVKGWGWEE